MAISRQKNSLYFPATERHDVRFGGAGDAPSSDAAWIGQSRDHQNGGRSTRQRPHGEYACRKKKLSHGLKMLWAISVYFFF